MNNAADPAGSWPVVSLADATARLTAEGALFEVEALQTAGRPALSWRRGPKTLADVFDAARAFGFDAARAFGELTFLVYEGERVSFEAFARAAGAFARRLVAIGVEPGIVSRWRCVTSPSGRSPSMARCWRERSWRP